MSEAEHSAGSGGSPTGTQSGDPTAAEDSVAVASAVAGDTTVTAQDDFQISDDDEPSEDPATPRFQEPVPPDGT
jgi:hypothetical protein